MAHVWTASGSFHARVVCARLGAAGILTEARGATEGPYPLAGCVEIFTPEDEAEDARALLYADADVAGLADAWRRGGPGALPAVPSRRSPALIWLSLALVGLVTVGLLLSSVA